VRLEVSEAKLSDADLGEAELSDAGTSEAKFKWGKVEWGSVKVRLGHTKLSEVQLKWGLAILSYVRLSKAKTLWFIKLSLIQAKWSRITRREVKETLSQV